MPLPDVLKQFKQNVLIVKGLAEISHEIGVLSEKENFSLNFKLCQSRNTHIRRKVEELRTRYQMPNEKLLNVKIEGIYNYCCPTTTKLM